jgi:hypothetical protein
MYIKFTFVLIPVIYSRHFAEHSLRTTCLEYFARNRLRCGLFHHLNMYPMKQVTSPRSIQAKSFKKCTDIANPTSKLIEFQSEVQRTKAERHKAAFN